MALPKASEVFHQKPVKMKPEELIPDGTDLNSLTDSVLAGQKELERQRAESLAKFADYNREVEANVVRAEMAAAEEEKEKEKKRAEKAKLRADEAAHLATGRQLRLKRRLADLTAECASVQSILDAIDDKNAFEIDVFKSTIAAVNKRLNP